MLRQLRKRQPRVGCRGSNSHPASARTGDKCGIDVGFEKSFGFLFINVTHWGPLSKKYVLSKGRDVNAVSEHHLDLQALKRLRAQLLCEKWIVFGTPARPSGRTQRGTSGGVLFIFRAHLALTPWGVSCMKSELDPAAGYGLDWVALRMQLKHTQIVLLSVYLTCNIGVAGENVTKLAQLRDFVERCPWPCALMGDWNLTPQELQETGFLTSIVNRRMVIRVPDVAYTCTQGAKRIIDFMVVDARLLAATSVPGLVSEAPWRPHLALGSGLAAAPRAIHQRTLRRPWRFDAHEP